MQSAKQKAVVLPPQHHIWAVSSPEIFKPFRLEPTGAGWGAGGGAVLVSEACLDYIPIASALASRYTPAGPLLQEIQGQQVLAIARAQAAKLARSMARDGRAMSDTTEQEAAAVGAAAVVAWRNGAECDGAEHGLRGVCWRAVVQSVTRDSLGDSIEPWRGQDEAGAECWDTLTGSALPLPALLGDGSRAERASRLLWERARAKRPNLLARRVESLKTAGGRGKRGELIDKVHRAAVLLLHGESVDQAAAEAGFKPSGSGRHSVRAGDRLMQAVRRLGFRVQFNLRQSEARERGGAGGVSVPMSAATARAWDFQPSACLPLQDGRGGKRRVAKLRRLERARAKAAKLARARAARVARMAKQEAKRRALARAARRTDKAAGWWARYGAAAAAPVSRTSGHWRGAARVWRG